MAINLMKKYHAASHTTPNDLNIASFSNMSRNPIILRHHITHLSYIECGCPNLDYATPNG